MYQLNKDDVKSAAAGRWKEILGHVANIPDDILERPGSEHPCPKCGGVTRCRLIDEGVGAIYCNGCFSSGNGDGIAVVQWMRDCSFHEALTLITDYLKMDTSNPRAQQQRNASISTNGKGKKLRRQDVEEYQLDEHTELLEWNDGVASGFCLHRKPAIIEGMKRLGARRAEHRGLICFAFPIRNHEATTVGWTLVSLTKRPTLLVGKDENGQPTYEEKKNLPKIGKGWIGHWEAIEKSDVVYKVEGVTDCLALASRGYPAFTNPGGTKEKPPKHLLNLLAGKTLVIVHDADKPGLDGATRFANGAAKTSASVKLVQLPYEVEPTKGKDLRDYLIEFCSESMEPFDQLVEETTAFEPSSTNDATVAADDGRPIILTSYDEFDMVNQAIVAVGAKFDGRLFCRGNQLVRVVQDQLTGQPRLRPVLEPTMRELLTEAIQFLKETDDGLIPVSVPVNLAKQVLARGSWDTIKPIEGIIRSPAIGSKGHIIQTQGYDLTSFLFYQPAIDFPIVPDSPTKEQAKDCVGELLDVVSDFPFKSDADTSVWLALVLTLACRSAIDGPCPLFAFKANTRGSGKTKLVRLATIISHGHQTPVRAYSKSDEEMRKAITSIALESQPIILLDNIATRLGCPSLDAALTSTEWSDRILGKSESTGTLPLKTVWAATGNNLELGADTARRTLYCQLESPLENPEERSDFKHENLESWAGENRGRLCIAALTIMRAFFVAGCPMTSSNRWGSFEAWSDLISQAIQWVGLPSPEATREAAKTSDSSVEEFGLLMTAIEEVQGDDGITAAEMARLGNVPLKPDERDPYPALREMFTTVLGKADARLLGYKLRKFSNRILGGKRIVKLPSRNNVKKWLVENVACGG